MNLSPLDFETDLDALTIPEIGRRRNEGDLTAVELTTRYLERIAKVDRLLGAVIAVSPVAVDHAEESDRRARSGRLLGPLDGIPVLLKDTIDVRGMVTTCGSRALVDVPAAADAALVRRLRAAGAVILGKANLSEWSNFRSWRCTSGWSAVGGQTNNPYLLDRNPGGSSAGSAVGVAASLAQVAVGAETDGSLVVPAGLNGVVAHKPSLGLVSRTGVMTVSSGQETPGPMARSLVDVVCLLDAMLGHDPEDPMSQPSPGRLSDQMDGMSLRGARLGLWPGCLPDVGASVAEAVEALRDLGATVVDVNLPYQHEIGEHKIPALLAEFRRDLSEFLASRDGGPGDLAGLVAFNRADPVELSLFGQEILELALSLPAADPQAGAHREAAVSLARRSIDETLDRHGLAIVVAPTNSPAWATDYEAGDACLLTSSSPAAVAGYPSVTVPAGLAGSLPVGLSFFAGPMADAAVLRAAYAFEQATRARRPPRYLSPDHGSAGGD